MSRLLTNIQDPTFAAEIEGAINEYAKEPREIDFIEHGANNIVVLVNGQYVFRFPRDEDVQKRMSFEIALLQKIGGKIAAVAMPVVLNVHPQPFYVVSSYIPGNHLTEEQIQALSSGEQKMLGQTIAKFAWQLHEAISAQELQQLRTQSGVASLEEPWHKHFERFFVEDQLPNQRLRPIVDECYEKWKEYYAKERRVIAIHDDVRAGSLLFLGSTLRGIVDFGDIMVGSIEEELRWVFYMGDEVLNAALETYQEMSGGTKVEYEHVRSWAILHELAAYSAHLQRQQTAAPRFRKAQENLRRWLQNFPL